MTQISIGENIMKLPSLDYPIFEVQLLSQKLPVGFRPFLVKEQKLMMMAAEAKDTKTTISTIKQIINNCLINEMNVDELPLVDLELLFINLRAKSIGEITNLYFKCENEVIAGIGDQYIKCGMIIEVPINLLEIPVVNKNLEKKISFSDKVGVMMKYPTFELIDKLAETKDAADVEFTVVINSIDYIFDEVSIYKAKDATLEELLAFVMELPPEKYELMKSFVENSPKAKLTIEKDCSKCGYHHKINLEGLEDFFI